jgi:glycosyltransferase involved in cell wall biosynthesis
MKTPIVSVVIPTYNSAHYIEEALESVVDQSFKDFEIIVIDDGSTDGTGEVLKKYGDRIISLFQDNSGCANARNRGIRIALGKYIAFLDADDLWMPAKLEKQVAIFNKNENLGMVTTGVYSFDVKGIYGFSKNKRKTLMRGDVAKNIFLHSNIGTPTVMVRKRVFDKVGLFEERTRQGDKVFLSHGSDDNMWIRIAAHFDVELIDEPLVKIRVHPSMMTLKKSELLESVKYNIHLLNTKYGDNVKKRIEKAIPIKTSHVQFAIGYSQLENGNYREARKAFLIGAYHWIWFWKNPLYLALTFMPSGLMTILKSIKRKLAPIPTEGFKRRR